MRTYSNSLGLAALMVTVSLAATAPFAGCGGDSVSVKPTGAGAEGGSGGGGGGGMGGEGGELMGDCGDGKVGGSEACDDGNLISGDGCEPDCSFTCNNSSPATGDAKCDDMDPCNGSETCQEDHTCAKGTSAPDGTDCGNGQFCIAGVCSSDVCGDLFVSMSEECDDGNIANGDGCDNCKFSCLSSDPARDCTSLDPCVATTCDDATHTCGKPIGDGVTCGLGQVCKSGVCTATICGDGVLEAGEICDDGNLVDADGCDADCSLSCVNAATDCPTAPTCQIAACNAANVCTTTNVNMDPACVSPNTCQNGACQAPNAVCGNGALESGEDCDFGGANGPNAGCETNCKFSCTMDANCVDTNMCNGSETCTDITMGGQMGKRCSAGMNAADCSACTGGLCQKGVCSASTCGDGCVDMTGGEQCEPPNTPTCDATCKTVMAVVCGNGVREMGEQCDDSNTTNMDGCSATCKFEQIHRVNWLAMQFGTDTYCMANRLGSAVTSTGQGTISDALTEGVNDGSISIMFQALGLDDLSGTNDPMLDLGSINGAPIIPMGAVYNGASDLDWWYTVDLISLDPSRLPKDKLAGSIAAKVLNAGPGALTLNLILGGAPASLKMGKAKITTSIGNASTPLASTGNPPGHLASENLDPALQSFATMGQPTANGAGKLCGNVTAASLAQVPVPDALMVGGGTACVEGYTMTNNFLDVLIGGCKVLGGLITVINIRQPDEEDPVAPTVGAGFPYTLTRNSQTKSVNGCRDKNMANVDLAMCLQDAAYSSFFKFATDRVIGK
ncbi:MAG: DUF4215 domain-containing protein [Polyangiaceae bacterium]|nr:DUF4215 domain-containing protein [Polyangiaceae bacterium]